MTDNQLQTIGGNDIIVDNSGRADMNPAAVYLARLAAGSRPTQERALRVLAEVVGADDPAAVPWHLLRFQHTNAIRAELAARYAPATANRILAALRGVLKSAWRLGLMSADDHAAAADLEPVRGSRVPAGRDIAAGELAALLNTCDNTRTGVRDAALISLMYATGLRRAERVGLDLADHDPGTGRILVRGKGNKERAVYVTNGAAAALGDWLTVRGEAAGPLFTGTGNRQRGARLTTQAIYKMLQTRAAAAGLAADIAPHDFRRTFVGELLNQGVDIATVARLAGHADVRTTARYDRRPEEAKRQAAARLHVPYRRRTLAEG